MPATAIQIDHLSKKYRLGVINNGTLWQDMQTFFAVKFGREDPHSKIGEDKYSGDKDHFWALKDISFDIKQGDRLGIIGKNGAGKSTLLKILSRITTPTEGTVKIKGKVASLLEVGTGFHGELTGRENIYLNGAILGMRKRRIDEKLDEIIAFSGIEQHIDTPVKRYSSGMYVRLAFAVAAHLDSDILIADEVLAVGDAEFQKKALGKMQELSTGEGRTVLFVSHNMAAVRKLCSNGILLKDGKIIKDGIIENVIEKYLNEFSGSREREIHFNNDEKLPMSIISIGIYPKNKTEGSVLDITDTIMVKVRYKVNEHNLNGTNVAFTLSREGTVLFRSWDVDNNQDLLQGREKGEYEAEFEIPDILNIGVYSISIGCGRAGIGAYQNIDDCLEFEIENYKTDGSARGFTRGGIIKSSIDWNLVKV